MATKHPVWSSQEFDTAGQGIALGGAMLCGSSLSMLLLLEEDDPARLGIEKLSVGVAELLIDVDVRGAMSLLAQRAVINLDRVQDDPEQYAEFASGITERAAKYGDILIQREEG